MVFSEIINGVREKLVGFGFSAVDFIPNLILAIILVVIGVFVGKFVKWILGKILIDGFKLNNVFKFGFVESALIAVKWLIYIVFLQLAFVTLQLPILSNYLTEGLGIIPGLISAVVIVIVGFAIAVFLKRGFHRTEKEELKLLGNILFTFVIYISLALALLAAFATIKDITINTILIISALAVAGFVWMNKENFSKT